MPHDRSLHERLSPEAPNGFDRVKPLGVKWLEGNRSSQLDCCTTGVADQHQLWCLCHSQNARYRQPRAVNMHRQQISLESSWANRVHVLNGEQQCVEARSPSKAERWQ